MISSGCLFTVVKEGEEACEISSKGLGVDVVPRSVF